jgi:hypothetical protein
MKSTQSMAEKIEEALADCHVVSLKASGFSGCEILPAEIYFFGCEKPYPPCFKYLEQILRHINLVGRPCGLFSPESDEAIDYLSGMVRDSELVLCAEPLFSSDMEGIKNWVGDLIH